MNPFYPTEDTYGPGNGLFVQMRKDWVIMSFEDKSKVLYGKGSPVRPGDIVVQSSKTTLRRYSVESAVTPAKETSPYSWTVEVKLTGSYKTLPLNYLDAVSKREGALTLKTTVDFLARPVTKRNP